MPAFGLLSSSSSTPIYIPNMKSSSTAANSPPPHCSSVPSPQFTSGTSQTTFPLTSGFSSLSPSFTPYYPQSQQKHSFSPSDLKAGSFASHENYYPSQTTDSGRPNYYPYTTHSADLSRFSNYTDYTGVASDYKFPWTSQGYYGAQSYDPWGSHGGWQEFAPTPDYLDSSHWGEASSDELLYANAHTGELRSPSYFPSDLLSYPPESALSEEESYTSPPRNTAFLPLPESCASSSALLLSHSQGIFATSSLELSEKSMEKRGSFRWPQINKNLKMDVSNVTTARSGAFIQERQPISNNDCDKRDLDSRKEVDVANGFVFSGLKGRNGKGEELGLKQVNITQEGQFPQIQSSFGLTCTVPESVPEQFAANSLEEDQLHPQQDQLILKSSILNLEQVSQEKGETNIFVEQDSSLHVSSVPPHSVELGKDSSSVSLEMVPQGLKPISAGIVQGATESGHCLSVKNGHSSAGGCANGSTSCTGSEHVNAHVSGLPLVGTSQLDQKNCKISVNEAKLPLGVETKQSLGEEVIADDDQDAESYKDSDCVLELSRVGKVCSKKGSLSRLAPSSNGCQLLISSMYNLSSVLMSNQLAAYPDDSDFMESDALEKTIYNLSQCLLKQSSDTYVQRCYKPTMNSQLIQSSSTLNLEQGLQGKGFGKDAPPRGSSVSSYSAEFSTDATLGSEQTAHQCCESFSAGTAQGTSDITHTSSIKSSWPSPANELSSTSRITGVMGPNCKLTDCACSKHTDLKMSPTPSLASSGLEKKAYCKSSYSEAKVSLLKEKNGFFDEKVIVDDVQNAQSNYESKCHSDSFQTDTVNLDNGLHSKIVPSSNRGQLLVSSMCNLSEVLLTSQSTEYPNGSEYVDLDAMEKTICNLSECLLKQLSDNLESPESMVSTQLIQKSNIFKTEQEIHGKGFGNDACYHVSSVSRDKFERNKESSLGFQEMTQNKFEKNKESTSGFQELTPECLESTSAGIVQRPSDKTNTPSIKSSGRFASKRLCASKNSTGVIGCTSGLTDYTSPNHPGPQASGSSPVAASNLGKKSFCKSFIDETKVSLAMETVESCNDSVILNDVWKAQSNEDSKCDLILSHVNKNCLNKGLHVKAVPFLNGCQLLISSMYNLSRVMLTCQTSGHRNGVRYMDLDAMEHVISILSDCLLKRSSDIFGEICHEPIDKVQQNFQEQLQGQKIVGQADVRAGSEDWAGLHKSSIINDMVLMEPSVSTLNQRTFLPNETELSSSPHEIDLQGTCLKIDGKFTGLKRCIEEAAGSSIMKDLGNPFEEVFDLQDKLLKLQVNIAYERNESNAVLSTYKSLWREAHEALHHSRSEIIKMKAELEGLKQVLRKPKSPGSDQSESKGFGPGSFDSGRDIQGLNQEDRHENTLDFIPLSSHNSEEEQQHSKAKLESESNSDFFESWGKGLPQSEEVMAGYFGPGSSVEVDLEAAVSWPVKRVKADLEAAVSFPDTREVISRFSLLQARGACSNLDNKGMSASSSPIDVDKAVAQRLSLLLARQPFDLNLNYSETISGSVVRPVFEESLGLASNLLNAGEGMPHDKTVSSVSQLPASVNSEMLNAESFEQQGFGKVDSRCLDLNPVSKEMEDDISRKFRGCLDRRMQVEGRGNKALQIESRNFIEQNLNSQDQLKREAAFLQDREFEETEIICLRPIGTENCNTCLEGDADWEHVHLSVM